MYTIRTDYRDETVIEKSRFICTLKKVSSETEAQDFIKAVKKEFWDATHNCSAYIIDELAQRSSDDGEPSGTAGLPMLEVLRKNQLSCGGSNKVFRRDQAWCRRVSARVYWQRVQSCSKLRPGTEDFNGYFCFKCGRGGRRKTSEYYLSAAAFYSGVGRIWSAGQDFAVYETRAAG